jgi:hypothetical protein
MTLITSKDMVHDEIYIQYINYSGSGGKEINFFKFKNIKYDGVDSDGMDVIPLLNWSSDCRDHRGIDDIKVYNHYYGETATFFKGKNVDRNIVLFFSINSDELNINLIGEMV